MDDESYAGRGPEATSDLKARIAAMTRRGYPVEKMIDILWERCLKGEREGYRYDKALGEWADQIR